MWCCGLRMEPWYNRDIVLDLDMWTLEDPLSYNDSHWVEFLFSLFHLQNFKCNWFDCVGVVALWPNTASWWCWSSAWRVVLSLVDLLLESQQVELKHHCTFTFVAEVKMKALSAIIRSSIWQGSLTCWVLNAWVATFRLVNVLLTEFSPF